MIHGVDITDMLKDGSVVLGGIDIFPCQVNIPLCFRITVLHKEDPGIGIEEGRIIRLRLDGLIAHLFSTLEIAAVLTEVVGVVVESPRIVILPLQATVVSSIGLPAQTFLHKDVSHNRIEVGDNIGITLIIDLCDPLSESFQSGVLFILLIIGQS